MDKCSIPTATRTVGQNGPVSEILFMYMLSGPVLVVIHTMNSNGKEFNISVHLADCAVDGVLPEKNLVTPQQANMEAVRWLERLERGEISTVVRRDLNVELAPVEIKKRMAKFGDFTKLNNRINNENSETTHHRMINRPN